MDPYVPNGYVLPMAKFEMCDALNIKPSFFIY